MGVVKGVTPAVRLTVLLRDQYRCQRCAAPIDPTYGDYSLQHRRARGMGGSRLADTNAPQNLVTLCGSATTGCHGWVEQHRQAAGEAGYTLRQGVDPSTAPVRSYGGRWYLLSSDGTRESCPPPTTEQPL